MNEFEGIEPYIHSPNEQYAFVMRKEVYDTLKDDYIKRLRSHILALRIVLFIVTIFNLSLIVTIWMLLK